MKKNALITILVSVAIVVAVTIGIIYTRYQNKTPAQKQFCGGIANINCPGGYKCQLDGSYPDAGGTCVKKLF